MNCLFLTFNVFCSHLFFLRGKSSHSSTCKGQGYLGAFQELVDIWGSSPGLVFYQRSTTLMLVLHSGTLLYSKFKKKPHQFIFTVNKKRVGGPPGNLSQARFGP